MTSLLHGIPETLSTYIERNIIPRYAAFDKAHRTDHAGKVIEESLKLAAHYEVNCAMVYTVAAYHDLGLSEGRERHHLVSGEILLADKELRQWFAEAELQTMREAVEDHRASNKQPPRSIYGRIVAEADRIIDPETTLRRTVQYGLSNYPELDKQQQYIRFLTHLTAKYAESGYLKLWIPESDNANRLTNLRRLIGSKEELLAVFEKLYAEEKNSDDIRFTR